MLRAPTSERSSYCSIERVTGVVLSTNKNEVRIDMKRRLFITMMLLAVSALTSTAQAVSLNSAGDSFGYEFLPALNLNSPPFGAWLPAGDTIPTPPALTGHDQKSAIKFDLSGLGLTGSQVASATLDLWVVDTANTGFGASPSAGSPVLVDLHALTGPWDPTTLTWSNFPAAGAQYSSLSINGINQLVSFDVTSLVQDWLDGALANNGLVLSGNAPVGSSPNWVIPVFGAGPAVPGPVLTITAVPEPSTVILALCSLPLIGWQCRRLARRKA